MKSGILNSIKRSKLKISNNLCKESSLLKIYKPNVKFLRTRKTEYHLKIDEMLTRKIIRDIDPHVSSFITTH